jgi:hypothetical protein
MIPADLINRLQPLKTEQPEPVQATVAAQKVDDLLSELQPGQRIQAEILSQMPNGTYRAMVAQREVTLALPQSAQAGDTLDLEVVDNDGKVALAVVAKQAEGSGDASVTSTLSRAGQLIGNLLADINTDGKRATPTPLGSTPLLKEAPQTAADLAPVLKEALTRSGMFYESHQANWVQGNLSQEALLQEPQGRLSNPVAGNETTAATARPGAEIPQSQTAAQTAGQSTVQSTAPATTPITATAEARDTSAPAVDARATQGYGIAPETAGIVKQQLEALATQTYAWQGQIWPGQQMDWEIVRDERQNAHGDEDDGNGNWSTRLRLNFPNLGGLEAQLRIQGGRQIDISLSTSSDAADTTLTEGTDSLRQQFVAAGLQLLSLKISHAEEQT